MADTQALIKIQLLLDKGLEAEAFSELQLLLTRQPELGVARAWMGRLLMIRLQDFAGAEEAFKQALRSAPNYGPLYYDYGTLLIQSDKATEAVAILNRALEVAGIEKDKIYRLFGNLYERQAKWDDALEYYRLALMWSLESPEIFEKDIERIRRKMAQ